MLYCRKEKVNTVESLEEILDKKDISIMKMNFEPKFNEGYEFLECERIGDQLKKLLKTIELKINLCGRFIDDNRI